MKKIESHFGYYISLAAILFMGFYIAFLFSYSQELQMLVIVLTAFFYVGWGVLHHALHHELTTKIVIEYILIGAIGIGIIFFVLKGGY